MSGNLRVELDAEFAALVRTDDYHVFVTPEGDCNGLFVSGRDDRAVEVRELNGGRATVAFSYRVFARRADVAPGRLAAVEPPPPILDKGVQVAWPDPLAEGPDLERPRAPRVPRQGTANPDVHH